MRKTEKRPSKAMRLRHEDILAEVRPATRVLHDDELNTVTGGILPGGGTITGRIRASDLTLD
jgi:hypothetical protein